MMKRFKLFGFTLAELMVVLAVLGVIAAVLLPTVFTSMPDENKLKFKKGYYTLKRAIDGMVNSEAYSATEGHFGKILETGNNYPYANQVTGDTDGSKYFCVQFSEMLNSIQTQCNTFLNEDNGLTTNSFDVSDLTGDPVQETDPTSGAPVVDPGTGNPVMTSTLDTRCANFLTGSNPNDKVNVITQDGVYWSVPKDSFSDYKPASGTLPAKIKNVKNYGDIPAYYAVICMDVDGPGGEGPFAFGIRRDGKVIAGAKAKTWLREGADSVLPKD